LLTVSVKKRELFCGFGEKKKDGSKVNARTGLADVD
jgi:hypothetical protein